MRAFAILSQTSGITETEVPVPEISADEILVKNHAVGVGVHDEYFFAPNIAYPYVVGIEAAGVVEQVGENIRDYQVGDRIAYVSMMQPKGGTWAEYSAVASSSLILPMPSGMSFGQAAAFPVAGNTILKALKEADVQPNETLFIAGGAGALGTLLIQVAASRGVTVVASASRKNHEYMKSLGAHYVIDYHDNDWQQQVRSLVPGGVDAAIAIHPGTPQEVQSVVKDAGVLVAVSGDNFTPERGIVLKGVFNTIDVRSELQELMSKVASGEVKQVIEKVYQFSEALDALEKVKTRHVRGKLVISF